MDLVMLSGLRPVSVLSTIVDPEDGSIASLPFIRKLALEHDIPVVSITDLIRYNMLNVGVTLEGFKFQLHRLSP